MTNDEIDAFVLKQAEIGVAEIERINAGPGQWRLHQRARGATLYYLATAVEMEFRLASSSARNRAAGAIDRLVHRGLLTHACANRGVRPTVQRVARAVQL